MQNDRGPTVLPISYNHLVQAAIYNSISPELSAFLHNKGFLYGKRSFKFFTFSRLFGQYNMVRNKVYFNDDIGIYVSSPIERFIREIANILLKKGHLVLGEQRLKIANVSFPQEPEISVNMKIRTLSPITVYSTLLSPAGNKKTYYYSPYEPDFSELIDLNAKKKFYIMNKKNIKSKMKIIPLRVRESIALYKGTIVKGWNGLFELTGPKKLIKIVYETGLGSKNSQGFGMFEVTEND